MNFVLSHEENTMLAGVLEIEELERNKRFITQQIAMYDSKG